MSINAKNLKKKHKKRKEEKKKVYERVYKRVEKRILMAGNMNFLYCNYEIPEFNPKVIKEEA